MKATVDKAWKDLAKRLRNAKDRIIGPSRDALMDFAKALQADLRKEIEQNTYSLAASTVARKRRQGMLFPDKAWVERLWMLSHGLSNPEVSLKGFSLGP